MEIFLDGGLFELAIAVIIGNLINLIFRKKLLLIIYSAASIISPLLIFFLPQGDIFYFLVSFSLVNSLLLVILLWKTRHQNINQSPIDISKFKKRFPVHFFNKKKRLTTLIDKKQE